MKEFWLEEHERWEISEKDNNYAGQVIHVIEYEAYSRLVDLIKKVGDKEYMIEKYRNWPVPDAFLAEFKAILDDVELDKLELGGSFRANKERPNYEATKINIEAYRKLKQDRDLYRKHAEAMAEAMHCDEMGSIHNGDCGECGSCVALTAYREAVK